MSVELTTAAQYRDVAIFERLTDEEIAAMLEGSRRLEVAGGEPVFREGDAVDSFYILESGKCVVRKTIDDGKSEIDLATLTPKAAFGEMGLVGKKPRIASVSATEASVVRRIERAHFERLVEAGHTAVGKVALNMARILSDRLDALNREFSKLYSKTQAAASAGAAKGAASDTTKKRLEELQKFKEQLYKEWTF